MILKFGFNYQVFTISQLLKLPYSIMIIYMVLYPHTHIGVYVYGGGANAQFKECSI